VGWTWYGRLFFQSEDYGQVIHGACRLVDFTKRRPAGHVANSYPGIHFCNLPISQFRVTLRGWIYLLHCLVWKARTWRSA